MPPDVLLDVQAETHDSLMRNVSEAQQLSEFSGMFHPGNAAAGATCWGTDLR